MGKKIMALILCSLLLCGCSKTRVEIQNRAFIKSIGIDSSENPHIAVSLYGEDEFITYDGNGETIFKAIENAEQTQEKNLFTGHLETAVFSGGDVKTDLTELLSDNRISPSCDAVYSASDATKIVSSEKYAELLGTLESKSKTGALLECNIAKVLEDMAGTDGMAVIPVIKGGEIKNGIINADGLVGMLTDNQTEGLCWLLGTADKVTLVAEDEFGDKINIEIRDISSSVRSYVEDGKVRTVFDISCTGILPDGTENTDKIKENACRIISSQCIDTVKRTVTELSADVLQIEKSIKAENYHFYCESIDNWESLIQRIDFEYNIDINM